MTKVVNKLYLHCFLMSFFMANIRKLNQYYLLNKDDLAVYRKNHI